MVNALSDDQPSCLVQQDSFADGALRCGRLSIVGQRPSQIGSEEISAAGFEFVDLDVRDIGGDPGDRGESRTNANSLDGGKVDRRSAEFVEWLAVIRMGVVCPVAGGHGEQKMLTCLDQFLVVGAVSSRYQGLK